MEPRARQRGEKCVTPAPTAVCTGPCAFGASLHRNRECGVRRGSCTNASARWSGGPLPFPRFPGVLSESASRGACCLTAVRPLAGVSQDGIPCAGLAEPEGPWLVPLVGLAVSAAWGAVPIPVPAGTCKTTERSPLQLGFALGGCYGFVLCFKESCSHPSLRQELMHGSVPADAEIPKMCKEEH